jgi:hypothetical protein
VPAQQNLGELVVPAQVDLKVSVAPAQLAFWTAACSASISSQMMCDDPIFKPFILILE